MFGLLNLCTEEEEEIWRTWMMRTARGNERAGDVEGLGKGDVKSWSQKLEE